MKKYFVFAAAALVALASCSKTEPDPTSENGPELTFSSVNYANSTKASSVTSFTNTAGQIGVFSWYSPSNWATDHNATVFMNDIAITQQTNGLWKAATPYYWPKVGKLSFIAYYPKSAPAVPENLSTDAASLSFDYAIDYTYSGQATKIAQNEGKNNENDLMVADFVKDQTSNALTTNEPGQFTSENGVALLFHHLLSKVIVKAGVTSKEINGIKYEVTLDALSINGINTKALYSNGAWGTASVPNNSGAFTTTTATKYAKDATAAVTLPLSTATVQQGNEYYTIPQTIPAEAKLTISYTVYVVNEANGTVLAAESYDDVEVALNTIKNSSDAPITTWAKNTVYQYTLNISPVSDEIYFDVKEMTYDDVVVTGSQNYPVQN